VGKRPEGKALKPRQSLFSNMVKTLHHNDIIDLIFHAISKGESI
jgi:hypothetical protein